MSRIAYILSAYKDAPHLARLISALDDRADFYVHIDLKADARPFKELLGGKVTFVPGHWVSWGGWEQVEYQKELLAAVLRNGTEYTRVVCLSGQDYPLWTNEEIHCYFDKHKDTEFIAGMNLTRCTCADQRSKIVNYHFFRDLKWKNLWWKNKLIVASRNLMKLLPVRKDIRTLLDSKKADIFFGSDYWAVTLPCARHIYEKLCSEKKMIRYFKTSFVPSELCIQTIVFNSPFGKHALLYEGDYPGLSGLTPLHYIEYGKAIKVLTAEDLSALQQSGKMFCRKVASIASGKLVEEIDRIRHLQKHSSPCIY
ncbi:beta-1,6-N-acetylglucosaminyltransferase [Bacteroides helcogenes]|uniref:Peptide O-xylosyltransferase n=1 Tax=Bacteroides helcogenes (strain ATCC 35417 / DSM 20613 / JCM 6297 / CCUG 15421 / P 36-108) TaxID=693979 RepID=E6SPJ0_BACT6|nr:beta-1,6-N-acetylglucosaminyltransferase [Bacteroides helcogenes]ADV42879.1 Core-2/I-Branching enzyme [Bacteroides helcogenes P 36-108]MDY5238216.1 beta-1,6-N-acetylglucosaminyltransferase [Bacteroides helcogenes]